jgi:hypothetical protein
MTCARLFFARRDNPDVVAQPPRNRLEQPQSAGVDAIVIGEKDAHE